MRTGKTWHVSFAFYFILLCYIVVASEMKGQEGRLFTSDAQLSSSLVNQVYQDKRGFIWIATRNGFDRYDGFQFQTFHKTQKSGSMLSEHVTCALEDAAGRLLVGMDKGLQVYDENTGRFRTIPFINKEDTLKACHVMSMLQVRNGDVWVSTSGFGMYVIPSGKDEAHYTLKFEGDNNVEDMVEAPDGAVWLAVTNYGIYRRKDGKVSRYLCEKASVLGRCCLAFDREGHLFMGSASEGLFVFDGSRNIFLPIEGTAHLNVSVLCPLSDGQVMLGTDGEGTMNYRFGERSPSPCDYFHAQVDLKHAKISSILEDRDGNIWLGLFQKGVFMQPHQDSGFSYVGYKSGRYDIIGSACVMSVYAGKDCTLWVGTDNDGLYALDIKSYTVRHYASDVGSLPATITCIAEDKDGKLWLGSYWEGAGWLDEKTGQFNRLPFTSKGMAVHVFRLLADKENNLWIATLGDGLKKYNLKTHELKEYKVKPEASEPKGNSLTNMWVNDLCLSEDGRRLYICMSSGLACLDLNHDDFVSAFGCNCVLMEQPVHTVVEDKEGLLWVGTHDGIFVLDRHGRTLRHYTTDDGLPDNYIASMRFDGQNNIWISTFHGLSMLDLKRSHFTNYYASNGLQGNEFSERASCGWDSLMVFGGNSGLTLFSPETVRYADKRPCLQLVEMRIGDKEVTTDTKSGFFKVTNRPVMESNLFEVCHEDNTFSIRLSTMSYDMPDGVKYLYSIDHEPYVAMAGSSGMLALNHLPSGTYKIRVKAIVNGLESDVKAFTVIVRSPWYASLPAFIVYFLIMMFLIMRFVHSRRLREEARLRLQEHIHAEQLNEMKLQFFMNLSHEIRTPMTLIVGPLQHLINTDFDEIRQRSYRMMSRNAERILALVNQILDLRKIDKGQMMMKMQPVNLVDFVRDVYELFDSKAREKEIHFHFEYDTDYIEIWLDKKNFDKVIMNLLSNAFKFTPSKGNIGIRLKQGEHDVSMEVWDDGLTIEPDKMEKIFQRFYQADNITNYNVAGSGIGLNLTKQLVTLHHGEISVYNNTDGKGCTFKVVLPLGNAHLKPEELLQTPIEEKAEESILKIEEDSAVTEGNKDENKTKHRKRIVIAEDDDEIRSYLSEELRKHYYVVPCRNGKEALSEVLRTPPSLVLSDVMMPEMDGYTLCAKIKTNINVNFIPVVLLTAKSHEKDKIEGLSTGADSYIEKPFNIKVLEYTIRNLIASYDILRNKVGGKEMPEENIDVVVSQSADDKLLERVLQIINGNINNPYLSVELIAREVGISRAHLHRKMKELTNQGPRDLVRNIRLKKAADLLASGHRNITEVMYACGFENAASFSIKFKALYGMSPMVYMKEHLAKK